MDPLCGMTRAVRAAARGDVRGAYGYNPGVFVLAAFASVALVRLLVGKTTSRWLEIRIVRPRFLRAVTAVAVMALWVNQQLHASHLSS